jgi:hypothetical protein
MGVTSTNSRFETLSDRQIVKDRDYLTDNLNANTLSRIEVEINRKAVRATGAVQIWECEF